MGFQKGIIVTKILTVTSFPLYNENQNKIYTTLPLHFQYIKTRLEYQETNTRSILLILFFLHRWALETTLNYVPGTFTKLRSLIWNKYYLY